MNNPKKKKSNAIPLLELLAYNSTLSCQDLLKKYNKPTANGYKDLQNKLADLYRDAKDQLEVEKEFANIHPHKELILKYLTPPPVETKVIVGEPQKYSGMDGETKEDKITLKAHTDILKQNSILVASVAVVGIVALIIYTTNKNK